MIICMCMYSYVQLARNNTGVERTTKLDQKSSGALWRFGGAFLWEKKGPS